MTWKRVLAVLAAVVVIVAAVIVVKVAYRLQHTHTHTHTNPAQSSTPSPSSSVVSSSAAPSSAEVAHTVADRFCRPDQAKNTWQRSLTPYLTPDAWQLYSAVRPANVPCADVHDDGKPVGDQQTSTDRAYQFTASTGGPVTVTLHRGTKQDPWLASYINAGQG